jgi:hypothetical protein
MSALAPIALFVYNRPDHTHRTVEALSANHLAHKSDLVVFSDGARDAAGAQAVDQVREIVRHAKGFASVRLVERERNLGLARSIIEGVGRLCNEHGQVIVVEDDLVTSDRFLDFMNDALARYRDAPQVMHVSAYMYPVRPEGLPETFFLPPASCWGWATWQRAWASFEKDPVGLQSRFTARQRREFNLDHAFPFWKQVELNARGVMNTWAIFWYASVFLRGGLCLHPRDSFVQNIGHDDSGTHSGRSSSFDVALNPLRVTTWCDDLKIHPLALSRLQEYFRSTTSLRVRARLQIESALDRVRPGRARQESI